MFIEFYVVVIYSLAVSEAGRRSLQVLWRGKVNFEFVVGEFVGAVQMIIRWASAWSPRHLCPSSASPAFGGEYVVVQYVLT